MNVKETRVWNINTTYNYKTKTKMSIYKRYGSNINAYVDFDNIFLDKYSKLGQYNKELDTYLFTHLDKMHAFLFQKSSRFDNYIDEETKYNLYKNIMRSTRELFYFQLKYQFNLVQRNKLIGMLFVSYLLACKNILEYDYKYIVPSILDLMYFSNYEYTSKQLLDMEMKLFENTNYCTETKVYNRIFNRK